MPKMRELASPKGCVVRCGKKLVKEICERILLAMIRKEQAGAKQLGDMWCRPRGKQRNLMCWRKEEEEQPSEEWENGN